MCKFKRSRHQLNVAAAFYLRLAVSSRLVFDPNINARKRIGSWLMHQEDRFLDPRF